MSNIDSSWECEELLALAVETGPSGREDRLIVLVAVNAPSKGCGAVRSSFKPHDVSSR